MRGKIMKLYYKRIHEMLEIVIFNSERKFWVWSSKASLRNLLDCLETLYLGPNSQGIYSINQCTESAFFSLGSFGPILESPQCFSEEQRDCLYSTPYDILPWINPFEHTPYSLEHARWIYPWHIPFPIIFDQTCTLMKPVDSKLNTSWTWEGPEGNAR